MANRWETMETVRDFILGGSRITVGGAYSDEIKTLAPWKKSYNQPRQHIKKQIHYFADKRLSGQSHGFPGCGSWAIKKAERQRIDAFKLWCWRRLLRVPWTARRSKVNPRGSQF